MIQRLRSAPWAIYLVLFAVAWSARAVYLAETADQPFFRLPLVDAGEYHAIAKAWAEGQRPLAKLSWQPWFYPLALAQLYERTGPSVWAAKLLQITVGALVCALAAALAFALWPRPPLRWIAGLAAAFYGPLIHVDGELLAESWAALWLVAAALVAVRYRERPRGGLALAFGALGALMLFTRPPLVAAWLPLLLVAAARWIRPPAPLRVAATDAVLLVVGFGLAAAPFVQTIATATGQARFLPVTGGINLYVGNSAHPCDTINVRPGYAWENLTLWPELHGARTDDEKDAFYRQQAWRDVRENPAVFVRNLGAKTRQFFSSREIPRNVDVYVVRDASRLLRALTWKIGPFGFPFGLLIGFAAIGLWAGRPRTFGLALAIAGYALAIIAVHVCDRYRLPAIPLFIALAAGGAWTAWEAARERRFGHVAAGAATIVLLGVLTSLGGRFCAETIDYRAELSRLVAITAYEQRDYPLAEACARQAVAQNPQDAQAWNQLGLLAIRRGESAAAEDLFRRAADSDPACAQAWFNLGKAANKRGDFAAAIGHYREGLSHSPAFLPAWIDLGDLLRQTGARDDAAACYREVLRIRPGFGPALQRLSGSANPPAPAP